MRVFSVQYVGEITVECFGFLYRYTLMGADTFASNDPWGVKDEPEEFAGRSNIDIRQQQQTIIQGEISSFY